jgi:hypothetical protein
MSNFRCVRNIWRHSPFVERHYHMSIRQFDLLSALKLACILLIFALQWGLLWQYPNRSDLWRGGAPTIWVIAQIQSFFSESKFLQAIIYTTSAAFLSPDLQSFHSYIPI